MLKNAFTFLTTMPKTNTQINVGDRVADRPKNTFIYGVRSDMKEIVEKNNTQRFGVVVKCLTKTNSRKQNIKYCEVLWDGLKTPSLHAQCRLCLIEDFEKLSESYRNGIGC